MIITIADAPQVQLRRILKVCEGIPVRAQMIPGGRGGEVFVLDMGEPVHILDLWRSG